MPRPKSDKARQKALAATTSLIVDGGIGAVSYDAVSAASGVAKTTLYRHWPDRDGLILDAVNGHFRQLDVPDTGELRRDLELYFERSRRHDLGGTRGDLLPSIIEAAQRDPAMDDLVQRIGAERSRNLAIIIDQARRRGELDTDLDDETLTGVLVGPLVFQKIVRRRPLTARYIAGHLDVVLAGLHATRPAAQREPPTPPA